MEKQWDVVQEIDIIVSFKAIYIDRKIPSTVVLVSNIFFPNLKKKKKKSRLKKVVRF